ncbi:LOW QUALITY PROTEIN: cation channel sperm-associated protein 4 [Eudromia elegans]
MASSMKLRRGNPDLEHKYLPINYRDVVREEDLWDHEDYLCRVCTGRFLAHPAFKLTVAALVITNVAVIATQAIPRFKGVYFSLSTAIDHIVLTVLFFEVLLNWYKGFWLYWKDGWNIFNFLIVVYLLAGPLIPYLNDQDLPHPEVFAMLGVILFSNIIPTHFGNLGKALYSLFVCVTQDGWLNIYQAFKSEGNAVKIGGAIYFLIFLTGGTFICANLLVAVVMTSLEESLISCKKKQKQEQESSEAAQPMLEASSEVVDTDPEHSLRFPKTVMWDKTPEFTSQEPLSAHLPNLNKKSFNNLSMLLRSIQDNLTHYKEIREELNTIVEEVRALDFNQAQEQELIMRSFLSSADNPYSSHL